jgi:hypothetical protein
MKTFCPNCEKETDSTIVCEVYECNECGEDNGNYEKPQAAALQSFVKQTMDTAAAIYTACTYQTASDAGAGAYSLPLLVWADLEELIQQAHDLMDGVEASNPDVSTTRDVLIDIKTAPDNNPDYNNRD